MKGKNSRVISSWHPLIPARGHTTPKCFNSAHQFAAWLELARPMPGAGFCADCTPEYKGRMLKEGRCHFPDTYWTEDEDFQNQKNEVESSLAKKRAELAEIYKGITESGPPPSKLEAAKIRRLASEIKALAAELLVLREDSFGFNVQGVRVVRNEDDELFKASIYHGNDFASRSAPLEK